MSISSGQVIYGLSAQGTPTGTNVSGSNLIGVSQTARQLTTVDVAYSLRCILFGSSDTMALNAATGATTGSTAFVAGTAQVETATAAGTIATAGNAKVVVTAAGMSGSPKTITFAVALNDTPTQWAVKCRTALNADAAVSGMFTVGGATDQISLTRKSTGTVSTVIPITTYAANDGTLNIALDNDTCSGITTAATSANTTAGVLTSGAKIYDGDGRDWEGETIVTASSGIKGYMVEGLTNAVRVTDGSTDLVNIVAIDGIYLAANWNASYTVTSPTTFTPDSEPCEFKITLLGATA